MKLILLAATALIATPVIAQDTAPASPATMQTTPPATDPAADPAADPATDPTVPQDATTQPGGTTAGTPTSTASPQAMTTGDPVGGYQPAGPATTGTPAPGAIVQFTPAASPSQAYPAPAPLDSYPVCKKGQDDKCRQRGGK